MKLSKMVEGHMTTNVYLAEIICKSCRERKISTNIKDQCKLCYNRSQVEFRCLHSQCNLEFRYLRHLCSHIHDDHHLDTHSCYCGTRFPTEISLRSHRENCNKRPVPSRPIYKSRGLKSRRNQQFAYLPTYDCEKCGEKFLRLYGLHCHQKRACRKSRLQEHRERELQRSNQPIHAQVHQPSVVQEPPVVQDATSISDVNNFANLAPQAAQSTFDCDGCGEKYLELLDLIYHQTSTCRGATTYGRFNFPSNDRPEIGAINPTLGQDEITIDDVCNYATDAPLERGEPSASKYQLLLCGTPVDPSETKIMLSEDKNVTFEEFLSVLPKNQVVFFENLSIQPATQTTSPLDESTPIETQPVSVPKEKTTAYLRMHDMIGREPPIKASAEATRAMPPMTQFTTIETQTSHFVPHSPDLTAVTSSYPLETGLPPLPNQSDEAFMFGTTGAQPPVDYTQLSVACSLETIDDTQPLGSCFDHFANQPVGSYPPNANAGIDSQQPRSCFVPHTNPTTAYSANLIADVNSQPLAVDPVALVNQSDMPYLLNNTGADSQPPRSFVNQFSGAYSANVYAGPDSQSPRCYLDPHANQVDQAYLSNITTIDGNRSLWEVPLIN